MQSADYNGKLQVANGKFRNCVAIINKVEVVRSLSSLRASARREGDRSLSSFLKENSIKRGKNLKE